MKKYRIMVGGEVHTIEADSYKATYLEIKFFVKKEVVAYFKSWSWFRLVD